MFDESNLIDAPHSRPAIQAQHYAIASGHYLATAAGLRHGRACDS
jgi:hypothetical protein